MPLKRIAITSNYDREIYDEKLVNLPPMPPHVAQEICDLLNEVAPSGEDYYKPVAIDYVPRKYEP